MTDSNPVVPAAPAAANSSPAPTKSPLDILEEILNDPSKKAVQPAAAAATGAPPPNPGEPVPAESALPPIPQPSEAEILAQQQAQLIKDQAELITEQANLQTIVDTPAYQARVQQAAATAEESQRQALAGQGFEIKQLDHTKIPMMAPDTLSSDSTESTT